MKIIATFVILIVMVYLCLRLVAWAKRERRMATRARIKKLQTHQ